MEEFGSGVLNQRSTDGIRGPKTMLNDPAATTGLAAGMHSRRVDWTSFRCSGTRLIPAREAGDDLHPRPTDETRVVSPLRLESTPASGSGRPYIFFGIESNVAHDSVSLNPAYFLQGCKPCPPFSSQPTPLLTYLSPQSPERPAPPPSTPPGAPSHCSATRKTSASSAPGVGIAHVTARVAKTLVILLDAHPRKLRRHEVHRQSAKIPRSEFQVLDNVAPKHAILATNTSAISITKVAAFTQRSEEVRSGRDGNRAFGHRYRGNISADPHGPASSSSKASPASPSPTTLTTSQALVAEMGKTTAQSPDMPSAIAIANRVLMASNQRANLMTISGTKNNDILKSAYAFYTPFTPPLVENLLQTPNSVVAILISVQGLPSPIGT
ncbi:hypothetical protein BDK51DRAFT_49330 [Blyttiomyces helicus]|uniref:3-hydroxyacyl-CoA dehydrogenase NAD binding domain-containing protein n=1 Tax=Blyttiomyces helicus TaxID=388810 RepID=A0A4V1IRW6_9FUNG|nr:hypothetical protein BDK51DRAFT_49330 [Blyttiomyces helicus]|eukprot:RKO91487.1 hypothetical protein BDK51DRAFT_49330 [Blyttiomyces helicus]